MPKPFPPTEHDHPFAAVALQANLWCQAGHTIFQKWTCEGCGERVTGENPNAFFTQGRHADCGHISDLLARGCNYLLVLTPNLPPPPLDQKEKVQ